MEKRDIQRIMLADIRNWFQLVIFFITTGIGLQFFIYVHQAMGDGMITTTRPPGVEGFLPIGALMGWKRFILTGEWDKVHPAAMVILGFAVILSFFLRKSFCSWFCPVGTLSEWLWKIGYKILGRNILIPKTIDLPLRSLKYILLSFFLYAVAGMDVFQISNFIESPYYKLADVKMLFFFTKMTTLTAVVLSVLFLLSLLFKNFWCRYLCPYGALLGLFSLASPTVIERDQKKCIDCNRCSQICPSFLPVSKKHHIQSPECTGCIDCIDSCPVEDAIVLKTKGFSSRFWSSQRIGLFIGLFFIFIVYIATITGNWGRHISDDEFRMHLKTIDAPHNTHPKMKFR